MDNDTISRRTAIDALERIFDRCEEIEAHFPDGDSDKTGYKMFPDYMTVWKYLHQLSSAHPEIICCKDCMFWRRDRISCEGYAMCQTGEGGIRFRRENDYCSVARRRTDE